MEAPATTTTEDATTTDPLLYYAKCPACSGKRVKTDKPTIFRCAACDAIFGECWLGTSYEIVEPYWDKDPNPAKTRYFDFMTLGSEGQSRRHGWYNPATKRITQTG